MSIKVFQVFHKQYRRPTATSWIHPIGVSGYHQDGFLSDSQGDNISYLNKYYCELTAIYYLWKNIKSDYIGLYHYRRYLNFKVDNSIFDSLLPISKTYDIDDSIIDYLTDGQQYELIKSYTNITDVIIPRKSVLLPSIKAQYLAVVQNDPWLEFEKVLSSKYTNAVDPLNYFSIYPLAPICNIFIMKWEFFDAYCNDLFDIVDKIYSIIRSPYNDHNNRYPGFLAERFLGFWLHMNKIKYLEVPMIGFK